MTDRVLAAVAVLLFAGFLAFLVFFVREIDLTAVIVLVVILAVHQIWHEVRSGADGSSDEQP